MVKHIASQSCECNCEYECGCTHLTKKVKLQPHTYYELSNFLDWIAQFNSQWKIELKALLSDNYEDDLIPIDSDFFEDLSEDEYCILSPDLISFLKKEFQGKEFEIMIEFLEENE